MYLTVMNLHHLSHYVSCDIKCQTTATFTYYHIIKFQIKLTNRTSSGSSDREMLIRIISGGKLISDHAEPTLHIAQAR